MNDESEGRAEARAPAVQAEKTLESHSQVRFRRPKLRLLSSRARSKLGSHCILRTPASIAGGLHSVPCRRIPPGHDTGRGDVPGRGRRYCRAEATVQQSDTDGLKREESSGRDQSALSTRAMETGSGKAWKRELGNVTNSKQPPDRCKSTVKA